MSTSPVTAGPSPPDYYDILGLTRSATDAEIKKCYRKLAMKWHPDKNQNSTEAAQMFQDIGEAYDVLSDKEKKAIYDQYGYEVIFICLICHLHSPANSFYFLVSRLPWINLVYVSQPL